MSRYKNTRITAPYVYRMLDIELPDREALIRDEAARGLWSPAVATRKIARLKGWRTRFQRWLAAQHRLPSEPT